MACRDTERFGVLGLFSDESRGDLKEMIFAWVDDDPQKVSTLLSFVEESLGRLPPEVTAEVTLTCDNLLRGRFSASNVVGVNWSAVLRSLKDDSQVVPRDSVWVLNLVKRAYRECSSALMMQVDKGLDASAPPSPLASLAQRPGPCPISGQSGFPVAAVLYMCSPANWLTNIPSLLEGHRFSPDSLLLLCIFDRVLGAKEFQRSPESSIIIADYALHSSLPEAKSWLRGLAKLLLKQSQSSQPPDWTTVCIEGLVSLLSKSNVYNHNLWTFLAAAYPLFERQLEPRATDVAIHLLTSGTAIERYVASFLSITLPCDSEKRREAITNCAMAGRAPGRLWTAPFATEAELLRFPCRCRLFLLAKAKISPETAKAVLSRLTGEELEADSTLLATAQNDDERCQSSEDFDSLGLVVELLSKYELTEEEIRNLKVFPWIAQHLKNDPLPQAICLRALMLDDDLADKGEESPLDASKQLLKKLMHIPVDLRANSSVEPFPETFSDILSCSLEFIANAMSSGQESVERYVFLANLCSRRLKSFAPFSLAVKDSLLLVQESPDPAILEVVSNVKELVCFGIRLFVVVYSWNRTTRLSGPQDVGILSSSVQYTLWPYAPFFFLLSSYIIREIAPGKLSEEGLLDGIDPSEVSGCLWEALGWVAFLQGRPGPSEPLRVSDLRFEVELRKDYGTEPSVHHKLLAELLNDCHNNVGNSGSLYGLDSSHPFSVETVRQTRFTHDPSCRFTTVFPRGTFSPDLEDLLAVFPFLVLKGLLEADQLVKALGWRHVFPVVMTACMCQGSAMTTRLFVHGFSSMLRRVLEAASTDPKEYQAITSYINSSLFAIADILRTEELPFTEVRGAYTISELLSALLKLCIDASTQTSLCCSGIDTVTSFLCEYCSLASSSCSIDGNPPISEGSRRKCLISLCTLEQCVLHGIHLNSGAMLHLVLPLLNSEDYSIANASRQVFAALYRTSVGPRHLLESEFSRLFQGFPVEELCQELSGDVTSSAVASAELICHIIPWSPSLCEELDRLSLSGKDSPVLPRRILFGKIESWLHGCTLDSFGTR